jgi:hypothetical protein
MPIASRGGERFFPGQRDDQVDSRPEDFRNVTSSAFIRSRALDNRTGRSQVRASRFLAR